MPRMMTWADAVMAAAKATTLTAKVMARIFMMVPLSGNSRICFIGRGFASDNAKSSLLRANIAHPHPAICFATPAAFNAWHRGQKYVLRCACVMRRIAVPHRRHGFPSRS